MDKIIIKDYLSNVYRIDNDTNTRHGKIRLDKSERVDRFEFKFFFIKIINIYHIVNNFFF